MPVWEPRNPLSMFRCWNNLSHTEHSSYVAQASKRRCDIQPIFCSLDLPPCLRGVVFLFLDEGESFLKKHGLGDVLLDFPAGYSLLVDGRLCVADDSLENFGCFSWSSDLVLIVLFEVCGSLLVASDWALPELESRCAEQPAPTITSRKTKRTIG